MEKNSTFLKSKKIILIDKTNFESSIALILREPDINYLIFLVFKNNIEEKWGVTTITPHRHFHKYVLP